MLLLRQSTASQEILLGQFVDSTDGVTAETGLTIANSDIKVWKAGATTLADKNSGGATHISNGYYYAVLDATDTNTLGSGEVNVAVSGALPVRRAFTVLPANVFDSIVSGSDYLDTSAVQFAGQTITCSGGVTVPAATLASTTNITSAAGITVSTNNDKTGYSLAATTGLGHQTADITGSLSGSVGSVTGAVGSVTGNVGGNVTGSVGSVVGAVGSVTGNVGGNVTGSVGSVGSGGITAASIATGAIDADALASDAVAEIWSAALSDLSAIPGATASVLQALNLMYMMARNKLTQTATTHTLYKDDGSTSVGTATVSDDGTTFTRGELS